MHSIRYRAEAGARIVFAGIIVFILSLFGQVMRPGSIEDLWCSVFSSRYKFLREMIFCCDVFVFAVMFYVHRKASLASVFRLQSVSHRFISMKLLLGVFCFRFICALLFYLLHLDNSEKEKRNSQKALNIPSSELTCTPV